MATWTLATSETFADFQTVTDGAYLYTCDASENIYRWTPSTDTMTLIADSSDFGSLTGVGINIFGGELYARWADGTTGYVYRFDGTAHSWTQVFSRSGAGSILLLANASTALIFTDELNGVWSSSNGTSWTQGTISVGNGIYKGVSTYIDWSTTLGLYFRFTDSTTSHFVVYWTGSAVASLGDATITAIYDVMPDYGWVVQSSADKYTANFASYAAYTGPPYPLSYGQHNMLVTVGNDTTTLYYFNSPPSWTSVGTVPSTPNAAVRLNDGTVYVVLDTGALYVSDEPVAPTSTTWSHSAGGIPGAVLV